MFPGEFFRSAKVALATAQFWNGLNLDDHRRTHEWLQAGIADQCFHLCLVQLTTEQQYHFLALFLIADRGRQDFHVFRKQHADAAFDAAQADHLPADLGEA